MPDMPEHIAKGAILKRIDEFSRRRPNLERLLQALQTNPSVADVAMDLELISPSEHRHLVDDWFNVNGWWQGAQPVEPIIAQGFILACQQALRHRLPLDCYWICYSEAGGRCCRDTVEFFCGLNDRQVTVMIHTPAPEQVLPRPPLTETEPIYVVRRGETGDIETIQPMHARTPDYARVPVHP